MKEHEKIEFQVTLSTSIKDFILVNWKVLALECILGAIFFIIVGVLLGVRCVEHFINVTP